MPLDPLTLSTLIGTVTDLAGSQINRAQTLRDIARQNEYNSPVKQIARLREAGLPFAAFQAGQAGSQSALPQTSGQGLQAAGNRIGNFITTQTQLKQLEILKEEIRLKRSEANKNEAETNYLLSGAGEDRAGTNLTRNLQTEYGIKAAQEKGANIANEISAVIAKNAPTNTALDIEKKTEEIKSIITNRNLTDKNIEGAEYDNAVKKVIAEYQPKMSEQQFRKLLAENGLIRANIANVKAGTAGRKIENDIAAIRYKVSNATYSMDITDRTFDHLLKQTQYEQVRAEFKNYKEYMSFVEEARNLWRKGGFKNDIKGMLALAYTTITGLSGNSPNLGNLLQGIGKGTPTYNYSTNNYFPEH